MNINIEMEKTDNAAGGGEIYDLAIIGGGPAGLSAGLYGARARLKTLLIERGLFGGQAATTDHIANYPGFPEGVGGAELAERMSQQAQAFGLETVFGEVTGVKNDGGLKMIDLSGTNYTARTLIIATGSEPSQLGVPGEAEFRGKGVSYCATCDGAFFRNKDIVVVGGGDAAVEEGIYLTRFARQVTIVHRRDKFRATQVVQEHAFANPKIKLIWNAVVEEIKGGQVVEAVKLRDTVKGTTQEIPASGVFIYVGTKPNTAFLGDLLQLDDRGYIPADERMHTSAPGIFAAGDVRRKDLRQVVTAVSDGAIAAVEAEKYVEAQREAGVTSGRK